MEPDHRTSSAAGAWTAALIVVAITLLSAFTLVDPSNVSNVQAGGPGVVSGSGDNGFYSDSGTGDGTTSGGSASGGGTRTVQLDGGTAGQAGTDGSQSTTGGGGTVGGDPNDPNNPNNKYNCDKGENAGDTDDGISGGEIKMAATVVRTGIAKDFLADAQYGIEAVRTKVNREGGICNRKLTIEYSDDGWNYATGSQTIQKWVGEHKYFGLIVNPSSEGLRGAIDGDVISREGFPVVGADGMLIGQYHEPWVWPIATSTHSVMQIMVNEAYNAKPAGARKFGIVWENNYRFGVEGAYAFKQTVKRRCPNCSVVEASIKGGELSYKNQVDSFIGSCKSDFSDCDFVALLLEPATASQWIDDGGLGTGEKRPKVGTGAPQPLFVDSFIKDCGAPCSRLEVWTSFKPPLHPFNSDPAVQEYVRDLRAVSSSADASNPHVQGAYVGASLFVEAMKRLGPAPTREGLRQVLDNMSFDSKLAPVLKFSANNKFAAVSAQSFEAIFNKSTFTNWQHKKSFVVDKEVHVDQLGY